MSLLPGSEHRQRYVYFSDIRALKNAPIPAFLAPWCNGYERSVGDYTFKQLGGQGAEARVRLTAPTTYSSKLGM